MGCMQGVNLQACIEKHQVIVVDASVYDGSASAGKASSQTHWPA